MTAVEFPSRGSDDSSNLVATGRLDLGCFLVVCIYCFFLGFVWVWGRGGE